MKEEFVSFDLAKKLKEKGFDWETREIYERNILACIYEDYPKPTISQTLKWLRKEKGMHIVCPIYMDVGFYFYVQKVGSGARIVSSFDYSDECFKEYEEATIVGINYVLDNLI